MEYKDYYKVMGLERNATQDEIKRAYRKLARKYHPDVSEEADAEARFKEVGEAYEVLKDPEKRAAYDQLGANYKAGQDFHPPPDWQEGFEFHGGGFTGADAAQFSDFFESLFGHDSGYTQAYGSAGRQGFNARGEDSYTKVLIDLQDAYQGATRTLTLKHTELGADGRPQLKTRTLKVRIPKGVRQGQHIRLAKQGGAGMGKGQPGDLYLEIAFNEHPFYHVEGKDVYLDLPIAPWEIVLGASIKVPTPSGVVDLKIPANSKNGQKLRLKGRGIPAAQAGDLYVVLQTALPPVNNEADKAAYLAFKNAFKFNPREHLGV
ncbi:MAG TPA: J domain-containing protein [Gammaproteobacteria bacterium]|nr:J domain-containing protein [Gammaproteobacteria bacterium]